MVVLQACAFAAPAPGNFISSLCSLEIALESKGIKTIYAFPERAKDKNWCKEIQKRTKVYFLPESQARLRAETYRIFKTIYKVKKNVIYITYKVLLIVKNINLILNFGVLNPKYGLIYCDLRLNCNRRGNSKTQILLFLLLIILILSHIIIVSMDGN